MLRLLLALCAGLFPLACMAQSAEVPRDDLTPGEVRTTDKAVICGETTGAVRRANAPSPAAIYKAYGITRNKGLCKPKREGKTTRGCEVDHRVPLEAGGANTAKNLWPQPYNGQPGVRFTAHHKDLLENYAHKAICNGLATPQEAQGWFLGDWRKAYVEHFGMPE